MELLQTHLIEPGLMLGRDGDALPPAVRVVCRYPFDHPAAEPRWVVEHLALEHERLEITPETTLRSSYPLLLCRAPLSCY